MPVCKVFSKLLRLTLDRRSTTLGRSGFTWESAAMTNIDNRTDVNKRPPSIFDYDVQGASQILDTIWGLWPPNVPVPAVERDTIIANMEGLVDGEGWADSQLNPSQPLSKEEQNAALALMIRIMDISRDRVEFVKRLDLLFVAGDFIADLRPESKRPLKL